MTIKKLKEHEELMKEYLALYLVFSAACQDANVPISIEAYHGYLTLHNTVNPPKIVVEAASLVSLPHISSPQKVIPAPITLPAESPLTVVEPKVETDATSTKT